MTWFEIYAVFGAPFVVLGIAMLVYWIAANDLDSRKADRHVPGE